MSEEKRLSEELLKQNGIKPGKISHDERERIQRLIARDKARLSRTKWAAIISWLLIPLPSLVFVAVSPLGLPPGALKTIFAYSAILFCVAIFFTTSYFSPSRSLTLHQMLASLSNIEEMLRRMSKDREADSEQ